MFKCAQTSSILYRSVTFPLLHGFTANHKETLSLLHHKKHPLYSTHLFTLCCPSLCFPVLPNLNSAPLLHQNCFCWGYYWPQRVKLARNFSVLILFPLNILTANLPFLKPSLLVSYGCVFFFTASPVYSASRWRSSGLGPELSGLLCFIYFCISTNWFLVLTDFFLPLSQLCFSLRPNCLFMFGDTFPDGHLVCSKTISIILSVKPAFSVLVNGA